MKPPHENFLRTPLTVTSGTPSAKFFPPDSNL